jgi:hypothetical protein
MLGAISTPMKEAVRSNKVPRVCPFIGLILVFGWAGDRGRALSDRNAVPREIDQLCAIPVGIVTPAKGCFCLTPVNFSDLLSPYSSLARSFQPAGLRPRG